MFVWLFTVLTLLKIRFSLLLNLSCSDMVPVFVSVTDVCRHDTFCLVTPPFSAALIYLHSPPSHFPFFSPSHKRSFFPSKSKKTRRCRHPLSRSRSLSHTRSLSLPLFPHSSQHIHAFLLPSFLLLTHPHTHSSSQSLTSHPPTRSAL